MQSSFSSASGHSKAGSFKDESDLLLDWLWGPRRDRQRQRDDLRRDDLPVGWDDPDDAWQYAFDNRFARGFIGLWRSEFDALSTPRAPTQCCRRCSSMLFSSGMINLSELRATRQGCQLCALILRTVEPDNDENVQVYRIGSALINKSNGCRILRLCSDLESAERPDIRAPIGFTVLPAAKSPLRFALLREWLQWCDRDHRCTQHGEHKDESQKTLPSRLLYVGKPDDPAFDRDFLKLVPGQDIGPERYIAVSHCWGELDEDEKKQYCTTKSNINDRRQGFSIADLPKTFQDAIEVSRALRVPYVWIDSLCIIQWDTEDWKCESRRMQDVFTSAYCTIAASSAANSKAGFLERNISSEFVHVKEYPGRRVFVCTNVADFDKDVEEAQLNTRAWVMQERFLSHRTIHFSANQTYWECGEGIYCEDLTQLKSKPGGKKYFKLDPEFPRLLFRSGYAPTLKFLQFFLMDYSKRGLTKDTDRAVALSGLAARAADALDCEERYGIFQLFLHRNLLWRRTDQQKTKRIEYDSIKVPSWSWMAYKGGIQFMEIRFDAFEVFENLQFDMERRQALITNVWEFQNCQSKRVETSHVILDSRGEERGWIQYDVDNGEELRLERSVVVGKSTVDNQVYYYVLIVRQKGVENEYERVGMGRVQQDYILRHEADVHVL